MHGTKPIPGWSIPEGEMTFCYACRHFANTSTSNFRIGGVCNFKKGAEKNQEHGNSESHAFAMEKWMQLQRNTTKGQSAELESGPLFRTRPESDSKSESEPEPEVYISVDIN